jgi:Ran GTPase-activating protein (RanGAP) involved in mRNA processing and transport
MSVDKVCALDIFAPIRHSFRTFAFILNSRIATRIDTRRLCTCDVDRKQINAINNSNASSFSLTEIALFSTRSNSQLFCSTLLTNHNKPNTTGHLCITVALTMTSLVINSRVYSTIESRVQKAKCDASVKNLSIREVHINPQVAAAVVDLLRDRQWERINMGDVTGQVDVIVAAVALALDNVQRLVLLSNDRIDHQALFALGMGLTRNTSLKYLRLRVRLSGQYAVALRKGLSHNKTLEHLHLRQSTFSNDAVDAIAKALQVNQSLKIIELDGCHLAPEQVVKFVEALINHPKLEHLNLNQNATSSVAIHSIASLLVSGSTTLSKLDLGQQQLGQNEKLDMPVFANALKLNSSLIELNLSSDDLDDEDVALIADALVENSTLQRLTLNNNIITDVGIQSLAARLPEMNGLKELWLLDNLFHPEGARALVDATSINFELERVYIARSSDADVMMVYQKQITYNLCLNMGGRKLLKAHNVPNSLWPVVFERAVKMIRWGSFVDGRAAQADVIFYLLQGPALFERSASVRASAISTTLEPIK